MTDEALTGSGGRMRVPRSRGAISGVALIVLGLWGGLAPFIGPYFNFAFTPRPNDAWHWTAARGWYEALPGGVAVLGGLVLLLSANRLLVLVGAWIAILAGGWFVVGPQVAPLLTLGSIGDPADGGRHELVAEALSYFTALGAVVVLFGALAAGRLSVRSVRDVRVAARRDSEPAAVTSTTEQNGATDGPAVDDPVPAEPPAPVDEAPVEEAPVDEAPIDGASRDETPMGGSSLEEQPADEPQAEPSGEHEVATSEHPDAPYAPAGQVVTSDPPADLAPQEGGPGFATPRRYVRRDPSQQIPVEQIQRDHPQTEG